MSGPLAKGGDYSQGFPNVELRASAGWTSGRDVWHSAAAMPDSPVLPPPRPSLKTFGPISKVIPMRLVEWELDRAVMELDVEPQLLNGMGVMHGGAMATVLDTACVHAGMYCTVPGNYRSAMTASLTVNWIGAVRDGRITVHARRRGGGKTLFMSSAEAVDAGGTLVALAEAVLRYTPGSERPEGIPRPIPAAG
jgi:uncharacterized protein (TIGR00369 family)